MKSLLLILIILLLINNNHLQAQEVNYKKSPAQISLVYPIGTGGKNSKHQEYKFSINALIGITGKVSGFEMAGLGNINESDVKVFQIAGLWNTTKGNFKGVRLAGLFNTVSGESKGVQVAGLFNRSRLLKGFQLALVNISDTVEKGISVGLLNIVKKGG